MQVLPRQHTTTNLALVAAAAQLRNISTWRINSRCERRCERHPVTDGPNLFDSDVGAVQLQRRRGLRRAILSQQVTAKSMSSVLPAGIVECARSAAMQCV